MKKHVYEHNEIVVGNNLAALLYSYFNHAPILFVKDRVPGSWEYFDFLLDEKHTNTLKLFKHEKVVGPNKLAIYNKLLFLLGYDGLMPFSNKILKIKILKGSTLKIITHSAREAFVHFKKARVFNPELVFWDREEIINDTNLVLDYFKIIADQHNLDLIESEGAFPKKIYFKKNIVICESYISAEELQEFDFSHIPLKYKLLTTLPKNNILTSSWRPSIILDFYKREIYPLRRLEEVKNCPKNVILDNRSEKDLCLHKEAASVSQDVFQSKVHNLLSDFSGMTV